MDRIGVCHRYLLEEKGGPMIEVVLHKLNGTTITYTKVTKVLHADKGYVLFTDETFGTVASSLPHQVKYNPVARAEEKKQS